MIISKLLACETIDNQVQTQLVEAFQYLFQIENYSIVGRELKINSIFSEIMNQLFMKSFDVAITRFESRDVTSIQVYLYL